MRVLGMISGTSHDGIDVAVVHFALEGDTLHGTIRHTDCVPYPQELRERLIRALPPAAVPFAEVCALDTLIGQAFAEAAAKAGEADLICSHGQTMYHWVDGAQALGTLQIGQPAWIAERTGTPVVADVRARDIAAGGQGAPLVALMDALLLAGLPGRPAALNLGGISNITVLEPFVAYDIGPGNALIDAAVSRLTEGASHYDRDGVIAASGRVDEDLLARLLTEPYYALPPPKTTGKELFNAAYLAGLPVTPDVIATLTALTAHTVAERVRAHGVDTLVVSGGGAANPVLMGMLRERVHGTRVAGSDEIGVPADAKEAVAFALIGWHTAHGLPAGTQARLLGSVTPGAGPLCLPEPVTTPPVRLRLLTA